jgi:hypothetical protein
LEDITYDPQFLRLSDTERVVLASAPVEGQQEKAVLYYPSEVVMRSEEELEAELASLRTKLGQ